MIFLILGILLAAGGVALIMSRRKTDDHLLEVRSTQTTDARTLNDLAREIGEQIGAGGFAHIAEVKGRVESIEPLKSELAERHCVWYRSTVEEEFEETVTETSSDGSTTTSTRRSSEVVSTNTRSVPFRLRDETDAITIDPKGAKIDPDTILDRHEPYNDQSGEIRIGGFSFRPTRGRRILGYRYREDAITVGTDLYVFGEASDRVNGELSIRKPSEKDQPFIVSVKNEEEIVEEMQKSATMKRIFGIILFVIGGGLSAYGIVSMLG